MEMEDLKKNCIPINKNKDNFSYELRKNMKNLFILEVNIIY